MRFYKWRDMLRPGIDIPLLNTSLFHPPRPDLRIVFFSAPLSLTGNSPTLRFTFLDHNPLHASTSCSILSSTPCAAWGSTGSIDSTQLAICYMDQPPFS